MFTEVARGLRRNITMTIAMVLTTAISLCLLGGGLIIARMTDQMRAIYGDKVEVTVYLTPNSPRRTRIATMTCARAWAPSCATTSKMSTR